MSKPPPRQRDIYGAQQAAMTPLKLAGVRGIVWRECRKVASPMLQEQMGAEKRVAHFFHEKRWVHENVEIKGEKPKMASLSEKEWQALSKSWEQDAIANKPKKDSSKPGQSYRSPKPFNTPFADLKGKLK